MKDYEMELDNRYKHGELYSADSIHFSDSLKCYTLRKHRVVYGGGGIMPDEFVPLDTTQYTNLHRQLAAKSIILNANLKYVDNNRKALQKKYASFEDFNKHFEIPQSLVDEILAEGAKQKIKPKNDAELKRTLPYLKMQMKALVARDLWDMSEYFQIVNESNPIVKKALQLIR
jgi:carboxyl-terminal processing protease